MARKPESTIDLALPFAIEEYRDGTLPIEGGQLVSFFLCSGSCSIPVRRGSRSCHH